LSIQCCLLDPYGRIKVVGYCLSCPCGCWWPQKLCWQLQWYRVLGIKRVIKAVSMRLL
jgi:hypothetical protein